MLMSVKEVADKLGVSEVTIYNKLKLTEFKDKVVLKQGSKAIDEELFNLIKESLNLTKNFNDSLNRNENKINESSNNKSLEDNKDLVNILINQLNTKDEQIAKLTKMLEDANIKRDELSGHITQLLENEQVLRRENNKLLNQENIESTENETAITDLKKKKQHWWNRK